MTANEEVSYLLDSIRSAFAARSGPPGKLLAAPSPDAKLVNGALKGKRWEDVPHDAVAQLNDAWFLLSPEAFVYYTPAWLGVSIVEIERSEPLIVAPVVIWGLTVREEESERQLKRFSLFSVEETTATRGALEFMNRWGSFRLGSVAEDALQEYWRKGTALDLAMEKEAVRRAIRGTFPGNESVANPQPVAATAAPEVFVRNLPGALLDVVDFDKDTTSPYDLVARLMPASYADRERVDALAARLSVTERRLVRAVLLFLSGYDPLGVGPQADEALEAYWDEAAS